MNKTIELIKENRLFFALLFYQILISVRIFIEMEHLTPYIFIHQLYWFTGVMVWFFVVFRYILKIEIKKLWFFAGGGILTYIPLIYATLKGERWSLNYVAPESFFQVFRDMATFMISHHRNWPMFPELVVLFVFTLISGTYLSKNFERSFAATILAVYGSFFIFGFSWISVADNHSSAFLLNSSFDPQKFYALQMLAICSVLLILTVNKEVSALMKKYNVKFLHLAAVFIPVFILAVGGAYFVTSSGIPSVSDVVISIPTLFLFSSSVYLAIKSEKIRYFIIPLYFSVFFFIVLFLKNLSGR